MEFDLYLNEYFASIGDFFEKNNPKLRLAACKAIEYIQKMEDNHKLNEHLANLLFPKLMDLLSNEKVSRVKYSAFQALVALTPNMEVEILTKDLDQHVLYMLNLIKNHQNSKQNIEMVFLIIEAMAKKAG